MSHRDGGHSQIADKIAEEVFTDAQEAPFARTAQRAAVDTRGYAFSLGADWDHGSFTIYIGGVASSPIALRQLGAWAAGPYIVGDAVQYSGNNQWYVCISPATGDEPEVDASWVRLGVYVASKLATIPGLSGVQAQAENESRFDFLVYTPYDLTLPDILSGSSSSLLKADESPETVTINPTPGSIIGSRLALLNYAGGAVYFSWGNDFNTADSWADMNFTGDEKDMLRGWVFEAFN